MMIFEPFQKQDRNKHQNPKEGLQKDQTKARGKV
jgi:hypothetical protein